MRLLSLNLRHKRTAQPLRVVRPKPYAKPSTELSRGLWPLRGLIYSLLFHEIAFSSALFISSHPFFNKTEPDEQVEIVDLKRDHVLYLPALSDSMSGEERNSDAAEEKATKGLSYPGPQNIVSDVPRPTNNFQTLLQPELVNPPTLRAPLNLPNILQMTNAGPDLGTPVPPPALQPEKIASVESPRPILVAPRIESIAVPSVRPVTELRATPPPQVVPGAMRALGQPDPTIAPTRVASATPLKNSTLTELRATPPPQVLPGTVRALGQPDPTVAPSRVASATPLKNSTLTELRATPPPQVLPGTVRALGQPDPTVAPSRVASATPLKNSTLTELRATPPPQVLPGTVKALDKPDSIVASRIASASPVKGAPLAEFRATAPPQAAPATVKAIEAPGAIAPPMQGPQRVAPIPAANSTLLQQQAKAPPAIVPKAMTSLAPAAAVVATAPKRAPVPTTGPDSRNLLSINPLPPPPEQRVRVPAGEARGRVAISTEGNLNASSADLGVKTNNAPSATPGLGKAADGNPSTANAAPKNDAITASRGGAPDDRRNDGPSVSGPRGTPAVNSERAPGNGGQTATASATPSPSPFAGITIQGGRLEPSDTRGQTPGIINITRPGSAPPPTTTPYNMTIVATAGSGGGLPDFGIFANEQVYTVYIDVKPASEGPSRSWTLQYSVANDHVAGQGSVTPPFPIVKEHPQYPLELLRKHSQRLVVVSGVIDTGGKLQQISVKQAPEPSLEPLTLAALGKWTFRPAELDGKPVSAKVLLGILLAP